MPSCSSWTSIISIYVHSCSQPQRLGSTQDGCYLQWYKNSTIIVLQNGQTKQLPVLNIFCCTSWYEHNIQKAHSHPFWVYMHGMPTYSYFVCKCCHDLSFFLNLKICAPTTLYSRNVQFSGESNVQKSGIIRWAKLVNRYYFFS